MILEFSRHIFEKYSNIKFHENPSELFHADIQTDRHERASSRFSQYCDSAYQEIAICFSQSQLKPKSMTDFVVFILNCMTQRDVLKTDSKTLDFEFTYQK